MKRKELERKRKLPLKGFIMYYPAIFYPAIEGGFGINFPDFPEISSQGETIEESINMGKDALLITVEEYIKAKRSLPTPSSYEETQQIAIKNISTNEYLDKNRQYVIQFFEVQNPDVRRVKVTFSLLQCELDRIDAKAEKYGMSRSALLVDAAEGYIPAGYEE